MSQVSRARSALLAAVALGLAPAPAAGEEPAVAAPPAGATLTVVVEGIDASEGTLLVDVFTAEAGWPKPASAAARARVPARSPSVEVRFEGLPTGPCAVSVVQDLDGNGKLTMRWFPYPRPGEPTGASNGAQGRFGPPSFEAARLDLPPGGATARVTLAR